MRPYIYILVLIPHFYIANNNDTLYFNRVIYPKKLSYISIDYSNDIFIGADYKDNFTIVLHKTRQTEKLKHISVISKDQDSVVIGRNISCNLFSKVKNIGNASVVYEIVELDSLLNFIVIRKQDDNNIKPDISVFYPTIKGVKIKNINGTEVLLTEYLEKNKLLYIDFWGLWCHQCIKDFDEIKKIYLENSDKLNILSLNYRDSQNEILSFVNENNIKWNIGITTESINRNFFVEWFPFGVLINDKGYIELLPCDLKQLNKILNNEESIEE